MNERPKAEVRVLPYHTGDGYGYGGGVIFCIGQFAIPFGEHSEAAQLAQDLAHVWNEAREESRK